MPATFLEGRRRSGKSLYAILKIQEYLKEGRKVATNLDLHLDKLMPDNPKSQVTRIPDFPRSEDLFNLGNAYDSLDPNKPETYDEDKNGLVVLDELLTSFNSRSWSNKDRLNVINWIVLSGKIGWDLVFIGQSFEAVDTQIRDTVIDRIGSCTSNDNLYPGFFWNTFVKPTYLRITGKKYFIFLYYGKAKTKENFSHRVTHKRVDLYECYNTAQIFERQVEIRFDAKEKPYEFDNRALYTNIGKHYFSKSKKLEMVHVKPKTKQKSSFPLINIKPVHLNYLLGFLSVFFACLYVTKPQEVTNTVVKEVLPAAVKKDIKPEFKPLTDVKKELSESDVGIIYINCSSYSTDGVFDYCFNDAQGNTIHPQYIGYKILYVNECHAKLKRQSSTLDVYCDPKPKRSHTNSYENIQEDMSIASL
jgi:hypothetical protein